MPEPLTREEREHNRRNAVWGVLPHDPFETLLRYEATIRDLEAQLEHERRANTALRMEIDRWRANDEGRAVRLREALELFGTVVFVDHEHPDFPGGLTALAGPEEGEKLKAAMGALAADREGP